MKSKILMFLSLIILAIGLIGIVMSKRSAPVEPVAVAAPAVPEAPKEVLVRVWMAKADLVKGQLVSREDFKIEQLPQAKAFESGAQDDVTLAFDDRIVLKRTVLANELVFPEDLISPKQEGYFNYALEDGYLPVPIMVRATAVLGDVIQPGALVDILSLASSKQNLTGGAIPVELDGVQLVSIVNGAKVLQVFKKSEAQPTSPSGGMLSLAPMENGPQMVSVIVQLTKAEAAQVTIAKSISQLEVLLSSEVNRHQKIKLDSTSIVSSVKAPVSSSVRELRPNSSGQASTATQ